MAIQIKSAGSKPATRKTSTTKAKPAARATKTPAKAAPKRGSNVKRSTKAAPKATAAPTRQRRSSKTDLTQAQLNKILKPLARDAGKRTSFHDQWKEYVASVNAQILAALDEGVPVSLIVEHGDISRQHVYKLLEDAKKSANGNGSKPAAKATAAKRGPGRPKGSTNKTKPATRKTTTASKAKPKIRARS